MNPNKFQTSAFTLIELIMVIALISLLAILFSPALNHLISDADRTVCATNLQQIGTAALQKAQDNNNIFPEIEGDPADPVYDAAPVINFADAFVDYGITPSTLRCPADAKKQNLFSSKGSSYQWLSFIDGENMINPKIQLPSGDLYLPLSRFPIVSEFHLIHRGGRMNILFADGRVMSFSNAGILSAINEAIEQ